MDRPRLADTDATGGSRARPSKVSESQPANSSRVRQKETRSDSLYSGSGQRNDEANDAASSGSSVTASELGADAPQFEPLRSATSRPEALHASQTSGSIHSEDDLFSILTRRRTSVTGQERQEEDNEIERLMSSMFGKRRQQESDQDTRHSGVVFRKLTVKGVGLGASLQPTVGDLFLDLPRFLGDVFRSRGRAVSRKPAVRELLSDFNGCVRPGEMLLVLGRPGSGCTTFLKTFCNQRAGFEQVLGDVTYGGADAKTMQKSFRGEMIYNGEDDLHYATLSVRRTLTFALQTRTPGKEARLEGETRDDYVKEFLRVATKLLWIEHTMETRVGNEHMRGVSGGERKRVSIAEALVTRASIQGWDNSSKGLDAATALEYVRSLRALTNMAKVSMAVSLYQAGESLYELANKVLLIDSGKCLYFGPADEAKAYFVGLGFDCPPRWTTADFLTSVTDLHGRSVRPGWEDRVPRSADDFADVYRKSDAFQQNLHDMDDFEAELAQRAGTAAPAKQKNYTISFGQQVLALTQRQFFVMLGDKASLLGKWGGIVFQAIIVGSLFYQLPETAAGAYTRGGVLFLVLFFNAMLALAEQTAAYESKPILFKHKDFSFYRPSAFALAQTLLDIPTVFIQVFLFDICIYWMAGLAATASQFFISMLILWIVTMTTYAFFRAISSIFKTLDDATKVTGLAIQILVVYCGYLIPPSQMHPWFKWLRWIDWIQYGFEMLISNEFYRRDMMCEPPFLVPAIPGAAPQFQSCTLSGATPGSTSVRGAAYIETAYGYSRSHLWSNFGYLCAFFVLFLAMTCFGMETMAPNAGGAAVTVFRRGQVPSAVRKAIEKGGAKTGADEELGRADNGAALTSTEEDVANKEQGESGSASQQVAKNEAVFTFENICYTIPFQGGERTLLQDVQGLVRPGKLTALMGSSGAGKTTLLNTLAQRINFGVVTGDFLVDGRPLPKSFQRATGFAEQMDIHEPTSTVREALQFSALLRQPKEVPVADKYAYCETIIDLLEMRDIAGATIGKVGEGLNQEQRKRLTIGVELASKPDLLMFLDEPTSGLDSGAAFNIVRFLRKLADAGQAILCTIHQPSAVLFEYFDELVLLKRGGRVVYAGELGKDSTTLIRYFEEHGSDKCPADANPAEWMLDAIGAGNPDYAGPDWGDVWHKSRQREDQTREIRSLVEKRRAAQLSKTLRDDREYAMPLRAQIWVVVRRSFASYWRNPNYIVGKFSLHVFTGLFNTFTFYKLGFSTIAMQSRVFSIFMALTISPPLVQQLQPVFLGSRAIFQSRENRAKIYSWFAWTTANVLVEIPYALVAGAVYFNCWWWGTMGFRDSYHGFPSGFTFICILLFELYYVGFGQAIAALCPSELLASLLTTVCFLFVLAFCGIVVPPEAIPAFWRNWMYWVTPYHYIAEVFIGVAIHNQPVVCASDEFARFMPPPGQTCSSYVGPYIAAAKSGHVQDATDGSGLCEFCQSATGDQFASQFSVFYDKRWRDFGIVCAFIAFNYFVVYAGTWWRFRGGSPFEKILAKLKK